MPTGKVKDDGDPGNMKGQRIGELVQIDANGNEVTGAGKLHFNNGRINGNRYYMKDDLVLYANIVRGNGYPYAEVIRRIASEDLQIFN